MPPSHPSVEILVCILRTCSKAKDATIALRLHSYASKNGLHSRSSFGTCMVSLLVEVGRMHLAQKVFDSLLCKDESSWSSLINGYVENGELRHALTLYEAMQDDILQPNGVTLVNLINACVKLKDVERGCKLHGAVDQTGILLVDNFVGSALVSMYVEFGLLLKAQEVCNTLTVQNVVAWNVLILGYIDHNQANEALSSYDQMRLKGVFPNAITFSCILKAYSSLGAMDKANEMHAEIGKSGLLKENLFLANVLVDTYAKSGMLKEAQEVFDLLPTRDVVTWTTLIGGYVQYGQGEEALKCYEVMQIVGPCPNAMTFACILRACVSIEAFEKCVEIHAEVLRLGFVKTDPFVGSALIDMYSKWGNLSKAREVLDMLSVHNNVVTWTALISGYVQHNHGKEALNCFEQMQNQGVAPNTTTFVCSLKACGSIRDAEKGSKLHEQIVKWGLLEREASVGCALVDMYIKCGMLVEAKEVFDMLPERNVFTWSALIMGYIQEELHEEALSWLKCMDSEGVSPNAITYIGSLKACGNIRAIEKGSELHAEIARKGLLEKDLFLGSTMIDMYANCGALAKAQEIFDMLPIRNVVTWNALINCYAQNEHGEMALYHFEGMKREAIFPNAVTYACVLKACGSIGAAEKGIKIHTEVGRSRLVRTDHFVASAMIDMYSKCGLIHQAQEVFDIIPCQNVVHWSALITGYAQQGEIEAALFLFERMVMEGTEPDCATFHIILSGCSHSGYIEKGGTYSDIMSSAYGIPPTLHLHMCVVDLLGRSGQLEMAVAIIKKTPCHPSSAMWRAMLGACKKWGQLELGRGAFHQAMQVDENQAAAYVCMSNICATIVSSNIDTSVDNICSSKFQAVGCL